MGSVSLLSSPQFDLFYYYYYWIESMQENSYNLEGMNRMNERHKDLDTCTDSSSSSSIGLLSM